MEPFIHRIEYKDHTSMVTEIHFLIACDKVAGADLIKIELKNTEATRKFISSASRFLKLLKKDGVIKLFVFESELTEADRMEAVYLTNKFPQLQSLSSYSESVIYVKL